VRVQGRAANLAQRTAAGRKPATVPDWKKEAGIHYAETRSKQERKRRPKFTWGQKVVSGILRRGP